MTHLLLIKTPGGFAPGDPETQEFHGKLKLGASIHSDFKQMRNAAFHRKLFALLNLGFEYWEPPKIYSPDNRKRTWGEPEKNFDRFRKDVTILAGYYHNVFRLDGTFRIEADSIAFGNMDQGTFDKLYQAVLTVLMKRIPMLGKMSIKEIDDLTNKFLEFA